MGTADPMSDQSKRSFLQLPVEVDTDRLGAEYRSIPAEAWDSSHWDTHCSANMVLLRGGNQGTSEDFSSTESVDHEVLGPLPYTSWLLGDSGPFGGTSYAFIFRMKPLGVTRPHVDLNPAWFEPFRIHVPITTNEEAFLLSEGRSKHLEVGEVWTFDNQSKHAVTNGDAVRTHLIFDVPRQPKLLELLEHARFDPGVEDPERWRRAELPDTVASEPYAEAEPISRAEKEALGLDVDSFASRVESLRKIARFTRADLQVGDIMWAVNGVSECAVARTATDYIQVRHRPGEVVDLSILRNGDNRNIRLRLFGTRYLGALRKLKGRL
jgi:Aspartyl/Asparaginyl beta-hydroxylase